MLTDTPRCGLPNAAAEVIDPRCERAEASRASSLLLDRLTEINLDDLFDSAGLMRLRHTPLQRLFRPSARRFARVAHEFDTLVGAQGLAQGSSWLARRMTAGTQVSGSDQIPATGPAVILANHPGMTDSVALIASLASRPDLCVIALDRPFLRALPNVARHLILVPAHAVGRRGVVRKGVTHLKQGGALLTFPAGEIEPDPATFGRHQAIDSVHLWSDSFVLFARQVPQTRFIPAIVSNVISREAQKHVLTLLRRTSHDRQRLAAALQIVMPRYQKMVARVAFGPAKSVSACAADSLRSAIVGEILHLIEASVSAVPADADDAAEHASRSAQLRHGEHPRVPRLLSP